MTHEKPRKFTRIYKEDGFTETWTFDLDVFPNGPTSVEIIYPQGYRSFEQKQAKLPITQQKFFNPETGKYVSYGRAKQLKLVK